MKKVPNLACNSKKHTHAVPRKQPSFNMQHKYLALSYFITQNIKKMCAQGLRFIKSSKVIQNILK